MIQHLVDNKQQITPALSKSLEDFAKTQYAAEEVGITTKPVPGTDFSLLFDKEGKFLGQVKNKTVGSNIAAPIYTTGPDGNLYRTGDAITPDGVKVTDPFVTEAGEEDATVEISDVAGTFKGTAKTKQEAVAFRKNYANAAETIPLLDELITKAEEGETELWGEKKARAVALQNIIVGKLRIALTGGGPLTKEERAMIKSAVRDPYAFFSLKSSNVASLKAVRDTLLASVRAHAKAQGLEEIGGPLSPGAGVGTNRNYTTEEINDPRAKKKK
jgi:hypothetical protein